MVHLYLRIASAKYMLRYLSSRQSGESYERYMFIGFNTCTTGASAKYILRYLSSIKSGESYEHYMFIGINQYGTL